MGQGNKKRKIPPVDQPAIPPVDQPAIPPVGQRALPYSIIEGVHSYRGCKWHDGFLNGKIPISILQVSKELSIKIEESAERLKAAEIEESSNPGNEEHAPNALAHFWFATYDSGLKSDIVAFDRFDCFVGDHEREKALLPPSVYHDLQNPRTPIPPLPKTSKKKTSKKKTSKKNKKRFVRTTEIPIPGNPVPSIRRNLIQCLKQLDFLHRYNMSSTKFSNRGGNGCFNAVWVRGQVKFLVIDLNLDEDSKNMTLGDKEKKKEEKKKEDIFEFGRRVATHLLRGGGENGILVWHQRDTYLQSFAKDPHLRSNQNYDTNHLFALYTAPFLRGDGVKCLLQDFSIIYHAISSTHHEGRPQFHTSRLDLALDDSNFYGQFLGPNGLWSRPTLHSAFKSLLSWGQQQGRPYHEDDARHFLRFLRNAYEHYYNYKLTPLECWIEIDKHYPQIFHAFHMKLTCTVF